MTTAASRDKGLVGFRPGGDRHLTARDDSGDAARPDDVPGNHGLLSARRYEYATNQTGEGSMPIATIRGVHINYQVLGEHGPWVALSPGGRRDLGAVLPLAEQVAAAGYRVLLHDRRNCGASDVVIEGDESE